VDPISTHRQDHFALSQLVTDVFEDPSDDASSQGAFGSPPVMVDSELGNGKSTHLRFVTFNPD
jgi:hypothetical protein